MGRNKTLTPIDELPKTLVVMAREHIPQQRFDVWPTPRDLTVSLKKRSFLSPQPELIHKMTKRGQVLFQIQIAEALPEFIKAIADRDERIAMLEERLMRLSPEQLRRADIEQGLGGGQ